MPELDDTLVDRIYEAAFDPDQWIAVIEGAARLSGSVSGALLVFDDVRPVSFRANGRSHDPIRTFCTTGAWKQSRQIQYFYSNPFSGFVVASRYFPAEMLDEEEALLKLKGIGIREKLGSIMPMPSGELVGFALHRRAEDGLYDDAAISAVNRIHPHIARAAFVAARLGLERAQGTVSALEALGVPAAVLSRAGRVLTTNSLLESVSNTLLPVAFGGMAIAQAPANKLFQEAIGNALGAHDGIVRSIPVPARDDQPALVVHVLPLRRSAHDIFSGADILVAATGVSTSGLVPAPNVLMGLFDLTPAEVKVVSALVKGHSLKTAAQESGIQFSTARAYLEQIFRKTGTHQQSQLVSLVKSAQPLRSS